MVVDLNDTPPAVQALTARYTKDLEKVFDTKFIGLFLYGAACFPPSPVTDFDGHALFSGPFTEEDRVGIRRLQEGLRSLPLGDEMDVYYVTIEDAGRSTKPVHQWDTANVDHSWALHRAHVHAGRFVLVKGPDPREIVPFPTWPELDEALQGELDFVAGRLDESPAYCTLNLCRILASYECGNVVMSKLQGAMWALGALDAERHELIREALRMYGNHDFSTEPSMVPQANVFLEEMSARIAQARTS